MAVRDSPWLRSRGRVIVDEIGVCSVTPNPIIESLHVFSVFVNRFKNVFGDMRGNCWDSSYKHTASSEKVCMRTRMWYRRTSFSLSLLLRPLA